jgi:hypothetical protein
MKYKNFNDKKNEYFTKNQVFIQTLRNKMRVFTKDVLDKQLKFGPHVILTNYLVGKNKQLERSCFRSLRFLIKKEKLVSWYRFIEIINRNLIKKFNQISKMEKPM